MAEEVEVRLHKATRDSRCGITLIDTRGLSDHEYPKIVNLVPDSIAAQCGIIRKGDLLISVNGTEVRDHTVAAMALKDAEGTLTLKLRRPVKKGSLSSRALGIFSARSSPGGASPQSNTPQPREQERTNASQQSVVASPAPHPASYTAGGMPTSAACLAASPLYRFHPAPRPSRHPRSPCRHRCFP